MTQKKSITVKPGGDAYVKAAESMAREMPKPPKQVNEVPIVRKKKEAVHETLHAKRFKRVTAKKKL